MNTNNNIHLRPRFYEEVNQNIDLLHKKIENFIQLCPTDYFFKIRDHHVQIQIKGNKKAYWSPYLHLEMEKKDENQTHIKGLFGPDPTLWTFFMFMHFLVAGVFIIFSVMAYSHYILKSSTKFDFIVMTTMVFLWFLLYVVAQQIRKKGKNQMYEIKDLFFSILNS